MRIQMQRPTGGCERCGGEVRTRKADGWLCWACVKDLAHA